jgi:hypothetical protein
MVFNPFKASSWKKAGDSIVNGVTAGQCDGHGCGSKNQTHVYQDALDDVASAATLGKCDTNGCGSKNQHDIYKDAYDSVKDTSRSALNIAEKIPVVGQAVELGLALGSKIPFVGPLMGGFLGTTPPDPAVQSAINNGQQLPDDATTTQRLEYWFYSQPVETQQLVLYGVIAIVALISFDIIWSLLSWLL